MQGLVKWLMGAMAVVYGAGTCIEILAYLFGENPELTLWGKPGSALTCFMFATAYSGMTYREEAEKLQRKFVQTFGRTTGRTDANT